MPFVRKARDRLGRLPVSGIPHHGRCRSDGSCLFAQSAPRGGGSFARGSSRRGIGSAPAVMVRVLGSAAGGGVPQWNCACANCAAVRAGRAPRRTESTLAISPKATQGGRWLLLNCSPDIASQVEAFPPLQPPHGRSTPIADILLTDANLDHIGGLAVLRQSTSRRIPRRWLSGAPIRRLWRRRI